ncbi:MAG: PIN domain nuclease [Micrococcales bacterium]|nr:PIN domain nuclease [Micrococcales bacterium]
MPSLALVDVNVLVALTWPQHVHHARARNWFSDWQGEWATCAITELGLVRLSMTPAAVGRAVAFADAVGMLTRLRALPHHRFLDDGSSLTAPTVGLVRVGGYRQVTDIHLVNLAASSGAVLATLDARLPDLLEPADRDHVLLLP